MENPHILWVDDDFHLIFVPVVKSFELAGYKVSGAHNGIEALQCIKDLQPDLIILDYLMPGLDGIEVLRRIRATGNNVPVIFLTNKHSDELHIKSFGLGANDFFQKPFRLSILLAHINALLSREEKQFSPVSEFANAEPTRAIKIFYCYSRKDKALRAELEKHLEPLRRSGQITAWYDREIEPGMDWKREINKHLNSSEIVFLLISPNFLSSDYCYGVEMRRALERHKVGEARVIPIILRPADWEKTPIGELQALPTDGKAIVTWRNRDVAFQDVVRGIRTVVEEKIAQL